MFADFYNAISRIVKYTDNKDKYIYNLTKIRDECKKSPTKFNYIDGKILKYIVIADINRKKLLKRRRTKLLKQKRNNLFPLISNDNDNLKDISKEIKPFDREETILEKVMENDNKIIDDLEKDIDKEVDISNDINEIIFCKDKKCYINIQHLIEILDNIIYQFKKMLSGGDIVERKRIQKKSKYISIAITALVTISLIPVKIFLPLIGTGISFTVSMAVYNLSTIIFKQIAFSKDVTSRFLTNDVIRLVDDYMKQRFQIFDDYFRKSLTEYTNITSYFVFLKLLDFDKFIFDYCKGKTSESILSKKILLIQQLKEIRYKIKHTFIKRIKSIVFRIINNTKYIRYIKNLDILINYLEDPKYDDLEILKEFYKYIYISNNTMKTTLTTIFNIDDNIKNQLEILKDDKEIISIRANILEKLHDIPYDELMKKQTYQTNIIALKHLIINLMSEQTNILSNYGKRILEIIETFNSFKENLEKMDVKQIELESLCVELISSKSDSKYSKFIRDLFGNLDNVFPEPNELYV
jgi:hypothetical protein